MPKLEPKVIQRELEQGQLWPVYWLYGQERMKSRELLKRIRKAVLEPQGGTGAGGLFGLTEESFDASDCDAASILDAAQSPSLGGGLRFIVVRDAHALKSPELLGALLGPRAVAAELTSVCVFLSKDLDGRKKFSKLLTEKAAVVPCEDVPEQERESWISYLVKRRALTLPAELAVQLATLDPWSLDIVDQELEKFALVQQIGDERGEPLDASEVLQGGAAVQGGAEAFLEAFFTRNLNEALKRVDLIAGSPDEALPLLGLLAWNVRHLALLLANGGAGVKINPYAAERLKRWARNWKLPEMLEVQRELFALDFQLKQTALLPLGGWSGLVLRFTS